MSVTGTFAWYVTDEVANCCANPNLRAVEAPEELANTVVTRRCGLADRRVTSHRFGIQDVGGNRARGVTQSFLPCTYRQVRKTRATAQ
jgi:hypothetical protein